MQNPAIILNTIQQAECLSFMRSLPDGCVDLIATDPPYRFHSSISYRVNKEQDTTNTVAKSHLKHLSQVDSVMGLTYDPKEYLDECDRICKHFNGYFFCNKSLLPDYLKWVESKKKYTFDIILWQKPYTPPNHNGHYLTDKEYCLFIRKTGAYFNAKLPTNNYRTIRYYAPQKKRTNHPTEKPLPMMRELILISSRPGDVVFDGYMGSGTTAIAAQETGRNFIGCDISEDFVKQANEILRQMPLVTKGFVPRGMKKAV